MILKRIVDRARTLRFKLALLYMAIFGTIQTALCIAILLTRNRELQQEVVLGLMSRGELIADTIDADPAGQVPAPLLNSASFDNYVVQVSFGRGIVKIADGVREAPLPPVDEEHLQSKRLRFVERTDDGSPAGTLLVYSFPHTTPDGRTLNVQIGRDLTDIEDRMISLRKVVYFSLSTALLLSGFGSWYAARRSLAPIGEVARNAREIAATDLHRRLPVPRGHDEVVQMVRVLNQMLDRLERAFVAHERFTADISHELKTPLTELITEASLMIQRLRSPEDHAQFVFRIKDRLKRLTDMVDSMLTLAQIESGLLPPTMSPVTVNDLVCECAQACAGIAAADRSVALVTNLAMPEQEIADLTIAGSPHLLEIAITNLIRNAIRFSPKNAQVEIIVELLGDQVVVRVGDHGPGIPPDCLDRVFERYFTVQEGRATSGGTGLGLAIVRGITALHGGKVSAANRPADQGTGCLFTVSLPRRIARSN